MAGTVSRSFGSPPFHWVSASHGNVPHNAVPGGRDSGETLYVGRAHKGGDLIPGKIIPSHRVICVPRMGWEYPITSYEALVCDDSSQLSWVEESGGKLPPGAIQGGVTANGEPLYIARAHHRGTLAIGKLECSHGCAYIAYGSGEYAYSEYEVLVWRAGNF
ncbi:uncharacterized protein LOC135386870 [Ornithodoros turicata]|uniref:uncharacterized protein LOC135386870 n=1 Tax=Ornithodoros turicata TaxID=34597 RepID=UPI003139CCC5